MAFLFAEKAFNIKEVFFFFFEDDNDTCYKCVLALTLFLSIIVPKTSLIILVFYISLVDERLLFLTRCINKGMLVNLFFLESLSFLFASL